MRSLPVILLVVILLTLLAWNLSIGAVRLEGDLWPSSGTLSSQVFWQLRMPRALLALFSGLLLAVTGAATQTLFRNPLADPSLIGVAAGSALAAVSLMVFGFSWLEGWLIGQSVLLPLVSFVGGCLVTLMVMGLANRYQGVSMTGILLVGMAVNAIATALIGVLKYVADDRALRDASYWLLGQFGQSSWWQVCVLLIVSVMTLFLLNRSSVQLNLWLLGVAQAQLLGVNIAKLKWQLVIIASIGVGTVVAFAGLIGFVGLMVPHLVRLWTGPDNRLLIPQSALVGASLLLFADGLSRSVIAPSELPVGIITALAGGPFFLFLIHLRYREAGHA